MNYYVYILECADRSFYTGQTTNLEHRLDQHETVAYPKCYTATRLPVKLVFSHLFENRDQAFKCERQIKGWSRKKKMALIAGNWQVL